MKRSQEQQGIGKRREQGERFAQSIERLDLAPFERPSAHVGKLRRSAIHLESVRSRSTSTHKRTPLNAEIIGRSAMSGRSRSTSVHKRGH